jgi:anti-anti-sigma factor
MENPTLAISNIINEIRSFEDRLISHFNSGDNEKFDIEKDVIIQTQERKIKELENEVEILKDQIDLLTYNQNNVQDIKESKIDFNLPVHYVKFGKNVKTVSESSEKDHTLCKSNKDGTEFSHYNKGGVTIISVNLLRATIENAISFKEYLDRLFNDDSKLIVDLSECVFFDSTFLGVLVSSLKSIVSKSGDIRIVLNDDTESVIFYVTRVDKIFKIFDNLDDAIESYSNPEES